MKVIYDPKRDTLYLAEVRGDRDRVFRQLKILNIREGVVFIHKSKYLNNRCVIIGTF